MRLTSTLLALGLLFAAPGCGAGLVNDPCASDDDCEESLMCDFHDGGTEGSCQEPHQH